MDLDVVILFDQVWIVIDDILLNLFASFGSVSRLLVTVFVDKMLARVPRFRKWHC